MCAWRRKLDYAKILRPKYFTSENIPIYGTAFEFTAGQNLMPVPYHYWKDYTVSPEDRKRTVDMFQQTV